MIDHCQCHHRAGSIHLITGPMFSGKTTELFRLVRRHKLAGKRVVIVKSAKDNRFDDHQACTHDMNKMVAISAYNISSIRAQLEAYEVIGIDEGQFFPDVVAMARELADAGKTVIVAALNGDYRQKPFQSVVELFALAEKIEKLSAVCQGCGHSASFTARLLQDTNLELIGGKEAYRAVCRVCLVGYSKIGNHIESELNGTQNGSVVNGTDLEHFEEENKHQILNGDLPTIPMNGITHIANKDPQQQSFQQSPIKLRGSEQSA